MRLTYLLFPGLFSNSSASFSINFVTITENFLYLLDGHQPSFFLDITESVTQFVEIRLGYKWTLLWPSFIRARKEYLYIIGIQVPTPCWCFDPLLFLVYHFIIADTLWLFLKQLLALPTRCMRVKNKDFYTTATAKDWLQRKFIITKFIWAARGSLKC